MPGVVIAGTHSGCGKTTITLGVLAALKKKGIAVQSFKAGPDFIDTGLHRMITGRPSRNLDLWMCGEEYVKACFHKYSTGVDISVVEGVMGLYDGDFSTARLADALNLPVILIVDAYGMAESAGAIVKGFMKYSAEVRKCGSAEVFASELPNFLTSGLLAGVIFNRVASERHYKRLKNSVQDIQVLGYLPRDLNFEIPHRHLGLTVAEENPVAKENIERLADAVLRHIDIDTILVMDDCPSLHSRKASKPSSEAETARFSVRDTLGLSKSLQAIIHAPASLTPASIASVESGLSPTLKIAVAYDKAFCFYYEDNLDLLKNAGAEIVAFSPISDSNIPDNVDAIYIGGGYPELYARELSKNQSMLEAIHNWADSGKPLYAECGGLMYLSRGIHDFDGNFFTMAGVFPFETQMKRGRAHLGYRGIKLNDNCILGKKGDRLRGHEFHYSEIINRAEAWKHGSAEVFASELPNFRTSELSMAYSLKNNKGDFLHDEGYRFKNTLASYIHIHFGSNPAIAKSFIGFITSVQNKVQNKVCGTISEAKSRFTSTQRESKRKLGETI